MWRERSHIYHADKVRMPLLVRAVYSTVLSMSRFLQGQQRDVNGAASPGNR